MICADYLEFQDILKKMRILDDKIVYALNTSIPTESFANKVDAPAACQDLYTQIQKGHSERENVIKNCIVATAETVKKLKADKEEKPNDFEVMKNLKSEQKKTPANRTQCGRSNKGKDFKVVYRKMQNLLQAKQFMMTEEHFTHFAVRPFYSALYQIVHMKNIITRAVCIDHSK